jgi:fused signal recognition particle receptor
MGSFNWFNRRYNDKPADAAKQSEAPEDNQGQAAPSAEPVQPTESPQSDPAQTDPAQTDPPAVNQDYLTWAKAAYANIRKQQAEPTVADDSTSGAPDTTPDTAPGAAPELRDDASPLAEPPSEPVASAESAAPTEAPQPEFVLQPEAAEPAEPATDSTTEPVAEPLVEAAPAALPFWAQAEAERLARLERIQSEAEQEAERAAALTPSAETALEPAPEIPDFVLDEAFLWSAEVLAAQGRRPDQVSIEEITWLNRLRQGLDKTRRSLVNQLRAIVGQGPLNQDAVTEIESLLLQADVGIEATDYIIESLQAKLRQETLPPQEAIAYLKQLLRDMLDKPLDNSHSLSFVPEKDKLNIWLITGVNGAGKTTTIGKLAHIAQKSGYRCLIAAADTFRAAAVQQVKVWGERSDVEVIANPGKNTDPAAVVFDAIAAAQSRQTELLLVDTAGRLQNKKNLMEELSKIRRIIDKKAPGAKVESLLVLDSTLGQNGLRQAEVFSEAAKLSGVVLTKLDGTAKGGIALAVVQQLGLPIRFIGAGEGIEDLRPFSSYEFIEALLSG